MPDHPANNSASLSCRVFTAQPASPVVPQLLPPEKQSRHGHRPSSLWVILFAVAMILSIRGLMAGELDGTYKLDRISSSLYVKGKRHAGYHFNHQWGFPGYYDDDFFERHSYPIPPEGILAAVLGRGVVVKNGRIRVNLKKARAEIVKEVLRDPRLSRVIYFNIKSLPRFRNFKGLNQDVQHAGSWHPLLIEVGLEAGDGVTSASAFADYQAKIIGKRLVVTVKFQGKGGPLGAHFKSYDITGNARIVARRN